MTPTDDHMARARELRMQLRLAEEASREHGPLAAVRYAVLADDPLATALAEAEARGTERAAQVADCFDSNVAAAIRAALESPHDE